MFAGKLCPFSSIHSEVGFWTNNLDLWPLALMWFFKATLFLIIVNTCTTHYDYFYSSIHCEVKSAQTKLWPLSFILTVDFKVTHFTVLIRFCAILCSIIVAICAKLFYLFMLKLEIRQILWYANLTFGLDVLPQLLRNQIYFCIHFIKVTICTMLKFH